MTGAVISRVKHGDKTEVPSAKTMLYQGDLVKAVGSEYALAQLGVLVGERLQEDLPLATSYELQSLLLTKKEVIGKTLGSLNLQQNFGCTVTRIRRSGIDLSPEPGLTLKFGDKLLVVGHQDSLKELAKLLGNDEKRLSDTDFSPLRWESY